jgi:hypothetical protein
MTERYLIGLTKAGTTKAGRPIAELYSTDTRLEFPVLVLFDLSMLTTVGIDPNGLHADGIHLRYWAHYEESDKRTSRGNPYRDVLYLEAIDSPATTTSTDTSAMLEELRKIRGLLQQIAGATMTAPDPDPYPAGNPTADEEEYPAVARILAAGRQPRSDEPQQNGERDKFFETVANARAEGVPAETVDAIILLADQQGWTLATECLTAEIARPAGKKLDHRHAVIARLEELLGDPLVATGQVEHNLTPGWQWTMSKAAIVAEGKRILAEIEAAK